MPGPVRDDGIGAALFAAQERPGGPADAVDVERIRALRAEGHGPRRIAEEAGVGRGTAGEYVKVEAGKEPRPPGITGRGRLRSGSAGSGGTAEPSRTGAECPGCGVGQS